MRIHALLLSCALACAACSQPDRVVCHFGHEATLGETSGGRYSGLAVLALHHALFVVLSSPEGLEMVPLDDHSRRRRIGPACDGGLAVQAGADSLYVACVRTGDADRDQPGRILVLKVAYDGSVRSRQVVAELSAHPGGVDLVLGPEGPVVAYADSLGPGARAYVWSASLGPDPRLLSNVRARAGSPRLLAQRGGFVVTWAETFSVADESAGQVWVANQRLLRHRVAEISHAEPEPTLVALADGLALGFRDVRRPYRRAGLYLTRLSEDLQPIARPQRVGRANAYGRPELVNANQQGVFALTPHRWDQHDVLIGVHALGPDLERRAPEQQDYEYAARIERARGVVRDGALTLLTTERSFFGDRPARARTVTLRCE